MIKYWHVDCEWTQWAFGIAWKKRDRFILIGPITIYFEV